MSRKRKHSDTIDEVPKDSHTHHYRANIPLVHSLKCSSCNIHFIAGNYSCDNCDMRICDNCHDTCQHCNNVMCNKCSDSCNSCGYTVCKVHCRGNCSECYNKICNKCSLVESKCIYCIKEEALRTH